MSAVKNDFINYEDAHRAYVSNSMKEDELRDYIKSLQQQRNDLWDETIAIKEKNEKRLDELGNEIDSLLTKLYKQITITDDALEARESLKDVRS